MKLCQNEAFLCLDCDRIVPNDYIPSLLPQIKAKTVIYSEQLFKVKRPASARRLKIIRDNHKQFNKFLEPEFRLDGPVADFGKSPFSGNFCMLKEDYLESGGYDPLFSGYGFSDTDYYRTCHEQGFDFIKLKGSIELHQFHGYDINSNQYLKRNVWNAYMYCKKWKIEPESFLKQVLKHYNPAKFPNYETFFSSTPHQVLL
jgi:hypothetical protein